ncbi:MAG: hypothetical protein WCW27_02265 [Patescibacteria group bacterium]|jgi:hypothetical protein
MIIFVSNQLATVTHLLKRANIVVWQHEQVGIVSYHEFASNTLERVHGIILEITQPTPEMHYLLAQAIILQKPTLCLYSKHNVPRAMLAHLSKKNIPRSILVKSYSERTLEQIVQAFLLTIDRTVSIAEAPTIKFTLRLTPALEQYLEWLARQHNVNKAEQMRALLKQIIAADKEYQCYLE